MRALIIVAATGAVLAFGSGPLLGGPCEPYDCDGNTMALWHFDEGAGPSVADVCSGNNGTITDATWVPDGPFGGPAGLHFDGDDDYVTVPSSASLEIEEYGLTIEAWVRMSSLEGYNTVVRKFLQTGGDGGYLLRIEDCGRLSGWVKYGPGDDAVQIVDDECYDYTLDWTHVAFTYDGKYLRLWRCGRVVEEQAENRPLASDGADLYIGVLDTTHWEDFKGDIAEVRISDIARTDFNCEGSPSGAEHETWGRVKSLYQ